MKRSALALVVVVLTLTVAIASLGFAADGDQVESQATPELPVIGGGEIVAASVVEYVQTAAVAEGAAYVAVLDAANRAAYSQLVAQQEAEAREAYLRAQPAPAPTYSGGGTMSGGGSCYGGPIPDYIVNRESGGNPMAQNPSGAFGCYQIMPEWWSGACSGFDRYTIDGQKACAAIIWRGGAGASNWAETL
jgi:hypothetical protein